MSSRCRPAEGSVARVGVNALATLVLVGALAVAATASARPPAEPLFRVTLLGTGNPRPSLERFGPSALIEAGEQRILLDAGRGASERLFQIGSAETLASVDTLLLTHLHSDHLVGLPDLWLTGWLFGRERPLAVLGPEGTRAMMQDLARAFEFDIRNRRDVEERLPANGIAVEARDVGPGPVMDRGGVKVTAFAVDHGQVKPSYGYRIDFGRRSVAFSGDTRYCEALIEQARGVDVLIHEVVSPEVERREAKVKDPARIERIIARHTTPEEAGRIFALVKPRLAVYTHIVPSTARPKDLIPPTRKAYTGPLEVGYDLMAITIGERIEVSRRATVKDK